MMQSKNVLVHPKRRQKNAECRKEMYSHNVDEMHSELHAQG
jgi:hypothetical protein